MRWLLGAGGGWAEVETGAREGLQLGRRWSWGREAGVMSKGGLERGGGGKNGVKNILYSLFKTVLEWRS